MLETGATRPTCAGLWVVQGNWFRVLLADAHGPVGAVIREPPSIIIGPHLTAAGAGVDTADVWTSAAAFGRNVQRYGDNAAYRGFDAVMYDPEAWNATPMAERRDPVTAFAQFSRVARAHGWSVVITPHPNLVTVAGAACHTNAGESSYAAFLRCDLTGQAARVADVVEVQAQGLQTQPDAYRTFVLSAADQARTANPNVKVIAGLVAGPNTSAAQMYAAWSSVRDIVDGYYLSISTPQLAAVAVAFIKMVDEKMVSENVGAGGPS